MLLLKGKREDSGNCRLVSLTSVPGKAMEQLILETISKYLKDKMTGSSQQGFLVGRSCLTDLIAFCSEMTSLDDEARESSGSCFP